MTSLSIKTLSNEIRRLNLQLYKFRKLNSHNGKVKKTVGFKVGLYIGRPPHDVYHVFLVEPVHFQSGRIDYHLYHWQTGKLILGHVSCGEQQIQGYLYKKGPVNGHEFDELMSSFPRLNYSLPPLR